MADIAGSRTCDDEINAALNEAQTRWPNLSRFEFATFMAGHSEWSDDGLHLNRGGQHAYARWLHEQPDAVSLVPPPES